MIIDFETDAYFASQHDVVDAETGEQLLIPIRYADDQAGVIRRLVMRDRVPGVAGVAILVDPATGKPQTIEERRAIRIIPRVRHYLDGN